jgi:hypothetical protein
VNVIVTFPRDDQLVAAQPLDGQRPDRVAVGEGQAGPGQRILGEGRAAIEVDQLGDLRDAVGDLARLDVATPICSMAGRGPPVSGDDTSQ